MTSSNSSALPLLAAPFTTDVSSRLHASSFAPYEPPALDFSGSSTIPFLSSSSFRSWILGDVAVPPSMPPGLCLPLSFFLDSINADIAYDALAGTGLLLSHYLLGSPATVSSVPVPPIQGVDFIFVSLCSLASFIGFIDFHGSAASRYLFFSSFVL